MFHGVCMVFSLRVHGVGGIVTDCETKWFGPKWKSDISLFVIQLCCSLICSICQCFEEASDIVRGHDSFKSVLVCVTVYESIIFPI